MEENTGETDGAETIEAILNFLASFDKEIQDGGTAAASASATQLDSVTEGDPSAEQGTETAFFVTASGAASAEGFQYEQSEPSQDIPPGYEAVSLIEALNGPMQPPAPLVPSFVPQIPPFSNSPDIRQKRHLERHHSSSASFRHGDNTNSDKDLSSKKDQEGASVPEVVASVVSSEKSVLKSESLSLTRGEGRRHRKRFRTSSAPEKSRLLANSVQIVNEVGNTKRKMMSSSLKEKARKSSRSFSNPLTGIQTTEVQDKMSLIDHTDPLHLKFSVESPLSFSDFVKTCNDKNVLQNFCLALKQEVAENEEKLGKLERIEHYHSKIKPDELIDLTEKWLTVSQEALRKLYEKLKKGNFQDFLNILHVDCNIINYEPDTDTFSH